VNGSFFILDADVDGSSLAVEEAGNSLENGPLVFVILERDLVVFVLCGEIFHNELLAFLKGGLAAHAFLFLHLSLIILSIIREYQIGELRQIDNMAKRQKNKSLYHPFMIAKRIYD
jgi:hypothetical protein